MVYQNRKKILNYAVVNLLGNVIKEPSVEFLRSTQIAKLIYQNVDVPYLMSISDEMKSITDGSVSVSYSSNRYMELNKFGVNKGDNLMAIYIALLRGINVGGKNMIKMADLKRVFEAMRLCDVQTYIQSGNVLFKSNEKEEPLRKKIEHEIEAAFGFSVAVVLRTAEELERIILNCPFSAEEVSEAESSAVEESLYVSLLIHAPSQEKIERLKAFRSESDEYRIEGREVFLLFRYSIRNSKLVSNLQKLDAAVTIRNWNTINKLAVLAKAMEA